MTFDHTENPDAPGAITRPAEELLAACVAEARYLAESLHALDQDISSIVSILPQLPPSLQNVDLLRQEAEGLAAVLALLAKAQAAGTELDAAEIARAVVLWAQRDRLHRYAPSVRPA